MLAGIEASIMFLFQSLAKQMFVVIAEVVPTGVVQTKLFDLYSL